MRTKPHTHYRLTGIVWDTLGLEFPPPLPVSVNVDLRFWPEMKRMTEEGLASGGFAKWLEEEYGFRPASFGWARER